MNNNSFNIQNATNLITSGNEISVQRDILPIANDINSLLKSIRALEDSVFEYNNSVGYYNNNAANPSKNDIIKESDYHILENYLCSLGTDCICYADCTGFLKYKYFSCGCNTDCGCNYFYYER